jgi:hypothetical protein
VFLHADLCGQAANGILEVDVQAVVEILSLAGPRGLGMAPLAEDVRQKIA